VCEGEAGFGKTGRRPSRLDRIIAQGPRGEKGGPHGRIGGRRGTASRKKGTEGGGEDIKGEWKASGSLKARAISSRKTPEGGNSPATERYRGEYDKWSQRTIRDGKGKSFINIH